MLSCYVHTPISYQSYWGLASYMVAGFTICPAVDLCQHAEGATLLTTKGHCRCIQMGATLAVVICAGDASCIAKHSVRYGRPMHCDAYKEPLTGRRRRVGFVTAGMRACKEVYYLLCSVGVIQPISLRAFVYLSLVSLS